MYMIACIISSVRFLGVDITLSIDKEAAQDGGRGSILFF
jgi:hypothetical protein